MTVNRTATRATTLTAALVAGLFAAVSAGSTDEMVQEVSADRASGVVTPAASLAAFMTPATEPLAAAGAAPQGASTAVLRTAPAAARGAVADGAPALPVAPE